MEKVRFLVLISSLLFVGFSQRGPINKLTLEKTYTMSQITKSQRDLIDKSPKASYFNDDFFNNLLKSVIQDKKYSEKEKAQLFYLMEKKEGYAFAGLDYVPPKQSYFNHHVGKVFIHQGTKRSLAPLKYNISGLIQIIDSNIKKDPILAGNALLLATLLNSEKLAKKMEYYTHSDVILNSKNPGIFNHYVCMSASITQNTVIINNLTANLMSFKKECMLEDVLCAIYSKDKFVVTMKEYILKEKNPDNNLSIETALCALAAKVPEASVKKSIQSLINEAKEPWKIALCKELLANKVPYNYALSNDLLLVTKPWEGVTTTTYSDGTLIINGSLMEFDPN